MTNDEIVKEARRELRAIRAEMKAKGIRRMSCFNGGHSPESYRLNSRYFVLETMIKVLPTRSDDNG